MLIRPNDDYALLGASIKLDKTKTYVAERATNQPDWEELDKIFVSTPKGSILLKSGEWTEVDNKIGS